MAKKLFGVDLDGVAYDFVSAFCSHLESALGQKFPYNEIVDYFWYNCFEDFTEEQFWRELDIFGKAGGYRRLKLIDGARDAFSSIIGSGNKLMTVTHRPAYAKEDTIESISEHFGKLVKIEDIVVTHKPKSEIVNEYGIDVFIDDAWHNIVELYDNSKANLYVMDAPYNRFDESLVYQLLATRVHSWKEFLKFEELL